MVNKRVKIEIMEEQRGEDMQNRQLVAEPMNQEASGLPEMVPVSVRSDLPEFQSITIERVLVGLDLTWVEFLALFKIELDPNLYIVKGSRGRQALLTDNVGEYVNTIKRRLKVYPVTIESINQNPIMSSPGKRNSNSNSHPMVTGMVSPAASRTPTATPPPPPPVSIVIKRKTPQQKFVQTNGRPSDGPPTKVLHMENRSDRAEPATSKSLQHSENQRGTNDSVLLPPPPPPQAVQKPVAIQAKRMAMTHTVAGPSKLKPKDSLVNAVSPVANSNNILNRPGIATGGKLVNGTNDDDSESSDDDMDSTRRKNASLNKMFDEFEIKPSVIQFLIAKISNKNMLRIREELLKLKAQDDYFQLTCVAPLAAGLLEQMLCRTHKTTP